MADGILTESYLDTGNRASFRSNGNIISIVNKKKQWNLNSAVDDRRHLGVLVGDITLLEHNESNSIDTHLKSTHLQGWDVQENPYYRWTNGNALLPIRKEESDHTAVIIIHIVDGGPYSLPIEQKTLSNFT